MKSFKQFLTEVIANTIPKTSKWPENTTLAHLEKHFGNKFIEAPHPSVLPTHKLMIGKGAPGEHVLAWVHKDTGHVDLTMEAEMHPNTKKEIIAKGIYITGRKNGNNVGHHGVFDALSGRFGKPLVTEFDSLSPGAIRMLRKSRETYGDKIFFHTFDPQTEKAEHLTHGVSVSDKSPNSFYHVQRDKVIVGMVPPKHRIKK